MRRWKRWLLLIGLLAGVAAGSYLGLRSRALQTRAGRTFSPTTRMSGDESVRWRFESPKPISAVGLLKQGQWWASASEHADEIWRFGGGAYFGDLKSGKVRSQRQISMEGPAIAADAVLYTATDKAGLAAMDLLTKAPFWQIKIGAAATGLAIADDRLIVSTTDSISALDAGDGHSIWSSPSTRPITIRPGTSGHLVCYGTDENELIVLDARTGKQLHRVPLCDAAPADNTRTLSVDLTSRKVAMSGEMAYICAAAKYEPKGVSLYAVNAREGRRVWHCKVDEMSRLFRLDQICDPVVFGDTVYLSFTNLLCAVDSHSGRELWRWREPSKVTEGDSFPKDLRDDHGMNLLIGTPVVRNGLIYFRRKSQLIVLDAATGREVWRWNPVREDALDPFGYSELPPMATSGGILFPVRRNSMYYIDNNAELSPPAPPTINPVATPLKPAWLMTIAAVLALALLAAVLMHRWRMLIAGVCLFLCAVAIWSWFDSYRADGFIGQNKLANAASGKFAEQTLRGIMSRQGNLGFGGSHSVWENSIRRKVLGDSSANWWATRAPLDESADSNEQSSADLNLAHFAWTNHSRSSGTPLGNQSETSLTLPHWFVILLLAIAPFAWLTGLWRDRRRYPAGHCTGCGYDLRASTDRCPECGQNVGGEVLGG